MTTEAQPRQPGWSLCASERRSATAEFEAHGRAGAIVSEAVWACPSRTRSGRRLDTRIGKDRQGLHGCIGARSGKSPHVACVSGWTPHSGRRQDTGNREWLPRRHPARHRCGGCRSGGRRSGCCASLGSPGCRPTAVREKRPVQETARRNTRGARRRPTGCGRRAPRKLDRGEGPSRLGTGIIRGRCPGRAGSRWPAVLQPG